MKSHYWLLLGLFSLISCKKEEGSPLMSDCIKQKIESFSQSVDAKTVQRMKVKEEYHFWFNTDARFVDGPEYILDNACDTVCSFGRLFPPQLCINDYNNGKWEVVWKK